MPVSLPEPQGEPRILDSYGQVVAQIERLTRTKDRLMLGIAGAPGVGKSFFAEWLAQQIRGGAIVVPFDGFHLSNEILASRGLTQRKGHIDTFDLPGFQALLSRLRCRKEEVVYAPKYMRSVEESIGSAIAITREEKVLIVEGNYLLAAQPDLSCARQYLDEVWYLEADDDLRVERLVQRHIDFGKTEQEARNWVMQSDEVNAEFVHASRHRADYVVAYSDSLLVDG